MELALNKDIKNNSLQMNKIAKVPGFTPQFGGVPMKDLQKFILEDHMGQ